MLNNDFLIRCDTREIESSIPGLQVFEVCHEHLNLLAIESNPNVCRTFLNEEREIDFLFHVEQLR